MADAGGGGEQGEKEGLPREQPLESPDQGTQILKSHRRFRPQRGMRLQWARPS